MRCVLPKSRFAGRNCKRTHDKRGYFTRKWYDFLIKNNRISKTKSRRAEKVRLFLHPVCPCVPLCRAGGTVAGQGSLERICPDFGRREKEGAWSKYLQGRALPDAKNVCRWKPAIKRAGISSNHPQCGDFLALKADIKIRRLTSIRTFFQEEIHRNS